MDNTPDNTDRWRMPDRKPFDVEEADTWIAEFDIQIRIVVGQLADERRVAQYTNEDEYARWAGRARAALACLESRRDGLRRWIERRNAAEQEALALGIRRAERQAREEEAQRWLAATAARNAERERAKTERVALGLVNKKLRLRAAWDLLTACLPHVPSELAEAIRKELAEGTNQSESQVIHGLEKET